MKPHRPPRARPAEPRYVQELARVRDVDLLAGLGARRLEALERLVAGPPRRRRGPGPGAVPAAVQARPGRRTGPPMGAPRDP